MDVESCFSNKNICWQPMNGEQTHKRVAAVSSKGWGDKEQQLEVRSIRLVKRNLKNVDDDNDDRDTEKISQLVEFRLECLPKPLRGKKSTCWKFLKPFIVTERKIDFIFNGFFWNFLQIFLAIFLNDLSTRLFISQKLLYAYTNEHHHHHYHLISL